MGDEGAVRWQAIEMLDTIATLLRRMAEETRQQRGLFGQSEVSTLDPAIVERTRGAYGDRLDMISLFREQLTRWRTERLSAAQSEKVDELGRLLDEDEQLSREILGIVGGVARENGPGRASQSRSRN